MSEDSNEVIGLSCCGVAMATVRLCSSNHMCIMGLKSFCGKKLETGGVECDANLDPKHERPCEPRRQKRRLFRTRRTPTSKSDDPCAFREQSTENEESLRGKLARVRPRLVESAILAQEPSRLPEKSHQTACRAATFTYSGLHCTFEPHILTHRLWNNTCFLLLPILSWPCFPEPTLESSHEPACNRKKVLDADWPVLAQQQKPRRAECCKFFLETSTKQEAHNVYRRAGPARTAEKSQQQLNEMHSPQSCTQPTLTVLFSDDKGEGLLRRTGLGFRV